jgi:long-chain acyl-CoA synthetase
MTAMTTTATTATTLPKLEVTKGEGYVEWQTPFAGMWPLGQWLAPSDPAVRTVYDTFAAHCTTQPQKPFLGVRDPLPGDTPGKFSPFRWVTWGEAGAAVDKIGAGLVSLGLPSLGVAGGRMGILAPNCPDWILCEYALFRQALAMVPIYPTCGSGTINTIIAHAEVAAVFCHASVINTLLEDVETPGLRVVIIIGQNLGAQQMPIPELSEKSKQAVASLGVQLMTLSELMAAGEAAKAPATPPKPADTYCVVYTSGSEGVPKGVVISHQNVATAIETFAAWPGWKGPITDWVYYSYLPLAHVFEQEVSTLLIRVGASIGYSSGLPNLIEDMGMLKPHFIVGVPRVWKRVFERVSQTVAQQSMLKQFIFNLAVSKKLAAVHSGVPAWSFWDTRILASVSSKLGGRLRFVISGSAAVDPELAAWFSAVFNVAFYQGYGLSETYAAVSVQH